MLLNPLVTEHKALCPLLVNGVTWEWVKKSSYKKPQDVAEKVNIAYSYEWEVVVLIIQMYD